MEAPLFAQSDSLRRVLEAAIRAPGNWSRFLESGLINQAGLLATDWQSAFLRIAPLTKAAVRDQPGQFLAQAVDVVFRGKTSGTSGESFTYFAGEQWNQKRLAARQHHLDWWGIDPMTPILNCASRLSPVRCQDTSLVGDIDKEFLTVLQTIIRVGPVVLRGYPSRLCEVAIALHRTHRPLQLSAVVAVIATGECLFAHQHALLGHTFDAPVINEYGCQESGISGISCPEVGRLHLDNDRCLFERVDGDLLTTDLLNDTLPMVRYSSGDVLHLFADPCPCGRPGLTAKVLGRQEEVLCVNGQSRWPGEFDLPAFPEILAYQIQLDAVRSKIWVQPAATMTETHLTPLHHWLTTTFNMGAMELLIEFGTEPLIAVSNSLETMDSQTWVQRVIQQPWSSWIDAPVPRGEAHDMALLLQQLVAPRHVTVPGLSAQTLQLMQKVEASKPAQNSTTEALKIRILLWATGLWAGTLGRDKQGVAAENPGVKDFFLDLLGRFQQWADQQTSLERERCSALGFDLLAPLLTLETQATQMFWQPVQDLIQQYWPQGLRSDPFTVHHYLAILDQAGQNAQATPHPWVPALRPLSAVLLGDFYQFASMLNPHFVAAWAEMVHGCPMAFVQKAATDQDQSITDCNHLWLTHRQALLQGHKITADQRLSQLFDIAKSPQQVAQSWREKGYATLVFGEELDPMMWVNILQTQVGILGYPSHSSAGQTLSNPLPWIPLLRKLATMLAEEGQNSLAYACLLAAAPPHRHISNFDRQTQSGNGKQSVVSLWSRG